MRIFISHGTDKREPSELQFLDDLALHLASPAADGSVHDLLLDRTRLDAGDDWAGVLHDWLAECQVAVLLLSPRALQRPWVLKEATILAFRRARDPGFPLIPLLLPGLDMAAVDAHPGFSALQLGACQAFAPGGAPDALAAFVKAKLSGLQVPLETPLDRLQQVLENRISLADAAALERACEALLGEAVPWITTLERPRQRARVLARAIARGRLGRLGTLADMTKSLHAAALAREHASEVLDLAASFWVEEEVAARLRGVMAQRHSAPQAAALNSGKISHGAQMAVWRAQLPDTASNVYWVAGGGSDGWGDELVERLCNAYLEAHRHARFGPKDAQEAADALAARTAPVFFVIPPPLPDALLLAELHQRFPSAIFIAHTGKVLPLPADLPPHIVPLSPGLDLVLELRHWSDYLTAQESLG